MRKAIVDIGSNSVLLLIAEKKDGAWQTIYNDYFMTRLGYQVKTTGILQQDKIDDTLRVLRIYLEKAKEYGLDSMSCAATMAVRMAENREEFLVKAEKQGTPVRVLSGEEEAAYGFLCIANDIILKDADTIAMIDPGAQSTELVIAKDNGGDRSEISNWDVMFSYSFPVGLLGLLDEINHVECPSDEDLNLLRCNIDNVLATKQIPKIPVNAITLGSPGTDMAMIQEKQADYNHLLMHGKILDRRFIRDMVHDLSSQTLVERRGIVGMPPGREGAVHIGALILERFLNAVSADKCYVTPKGWRYALLDE